AACCAPTPTRGCPPAGLWHTAPLFCPPPPKMHKIIQQLAQEIQVGAHQVSAAIELLDGGATVPFIARYRKEVTGGLDDVQLRALEARLSYLRELDERRAAVLKAIDEQGKLTDLLRAT